MKHADTILALVDGSNLTQAVADAAMWSGDALNAKLTLLHSITSLDANQHSEVHGLLGFGADKKLLSELHEFDNLRNAVALKLGNTLLKNIESYLLDYGFNDIKTELKFGNLFENIKALNQSFALIVAGVYGEKHAKRDDPKALGSHVESLIRELSTPILLTHTPFLQPKNFMIAYDARDSIDRAINSDLLERLLEGAVCHLITVDNGIANQAQKFNDAKKILESKGFVVTAHTLKGNVTDALVEYQQQHKIEMIIMGAFAHSKIRRFFLGSHTLDLISNTSNPVLIFT